MTPNKSLEHNTAPALGFGVRLWWHCGLRGHYVVVGAVWLSLSLCPKAVIEVAPVFCESFERGFFCRARSATFAFDFRAKD